MDHSSMDHSSMDHSSMDHSSMDHSSMDHSGMDHSGMEMPMPGGIPLAGEGRDRDGLNLDRLMVPLGPYLPLWPAGLVLHCELQGDVVFDSSLEYAYEPRPVEAGSAPTPGARSTLVRFTDLAARLLGVAGAEDGARRIRRVRDKALDGTDLDQCRRELGAEQTRLRRSWFLRRSLRGIGLLQDSTPAFREGTDAWDRLLDMLSAAASGAPAPVPAEPMASTLPQLVRGQELSVVRVIVASLDLSPVAAPLEPAP